MHTVYPTEKITQPKLPSSILYRGHLVDALTQVIIGTEAAETYTEYKLVLLCAPAGYGKTTLLADFVRHTGVACCWYFLESVDRDICTFLHQLIACIRQKFPQFGLELDAQLTYCLSKGMQSTDHLHLLEQLIDRIVAEMQTTIHERFVLCICNYHEVNSNDKINALLNRLIFCLPPHGIIVIESRTTPALELASLLTRRQIFCLGSDSLRFKLEDIRNLATLQQREPLTESELERLDVHFSGWIAGILLGTHLGNAQFLAASEYEEHIWAAPALYLDWQRLIAYLQDEVFRDEPEVYEFLKAASILQHMTPDACNAVLDLHDADARLQYMEYHGLFVTHDDSDSERIYLCHPLLREMLSNELYQHDAARAADLHERAAIFFYYQNTYEKAIEHAFAAFDENLAAEMIEKTFSCLLAQGRFDTVAQWIDRLPEAILADSPLLLFARGTVYLAAHETALALTLFENAHTLLLHDLPGTDGDSMPTLLAEIFIAQASAFFEQGKYVESQHVCEKALSLLSVDECQLRAKAYQRLGMCASLLGDCMAGIAYMQQALQLWEHKTEIVEIAVLHGHLANAYNLIGNYSLSEYHRSRAIEGCSRLGYAAGKINNIIGMAITKRNKGSLDEAKTVLLEALALSREVQFQRGEAYALENLGEIYQDQENFKQALAVTEDALSLASQLDDGYLINAALCSLAITYLYMGDAQTAFLLVERTKINVDNKSCYEYVLCELTRGTILFALQRYHEACHILEEIKVSSDVIGLKRFYLRVLIRLTACQMALGQQEKALASLQEIGHLMKQEHYEHIALIELRRFPALKRTIQDSVLLANAKSGSSQALTLLADAHQRASQATESKAKLQIMALGEPALIIDGSPVTRWRMSRSMELFFFLLDQDRPVRKEQIMHALWPSIDERIGQSLRSTIFYLRKAIGDVCVPYRSGSYRLELSALYGENVWYDVEAFEYHYLEAKKAIAAQDAVEARKYLECVIALYRGDYVQSLYGDWCIFRRDELLRTYMEARKQLAMLAWSTKEFDESIEHWQKLLIVDNCLEDAHYGLMQCYVAQGKRGLALRQYQLCADILHKELSIAPGNEVQKMYNKLIDA